MIACRFYRAPVEPTLENRDEHRHANAKADRETSNPLKTDEPTAPV